MHQALFQDEGCYAKCSQSNLITFVEEWLENLLQVDLNNCTRHPTKWTKCLAKKKLSCRMRGIVVRPTPAFALCLVQSLITTTGTPFKESNIGPRPKRVRYDGCKLECIWSLIYILTYTLGRVQYTSGWNLGLYLWPITLKRDGVVNRVDQFRV